MMRTLVVGGTGPTGPFIVNGLRERGRQVTIFHRGTHELDEIPDDVASHPRRSTLQRDDRGGAGRRTFDEVIASYGRIRLLAQALEGRVGRFISVGGMRRVPGLRRPATCSAIGVCRRSVPEDAPRADDEVGSSSARLIAETEDTVFTYHPTATMFRYPYVYGPYQLVPREWSIVRRDPRRPQPDPGSRLRDTLLPPTVGRATWPTPCCWRLTSPTPRRATPTTAATSTSSRFDQVVEVWPARSGPGWSGWPCRGRCRVRPGRRLIVEPTTSWTCPGAGTTSGTGRAHPPPRRSPGPFAGTPSTHRRSRSRGSLGDPFDYEWEDQMVDTALMRPWSDGRPAAAGAATATRSTPTRAARFRPHPYAHPDAGNQLRDHRGR